MITEPETLARVLNQALPYIQEFRGQTFVVKYGGSAMRDPSVVEGVLRNVLLLGLVGIRCVLVHGGGPEIDHWLKRLDIPKRTLSGLRVTDEETMEVVEMALLKSNKNLVGEIQRLSGSAIGLSGRDDDLLVGRPISDALGRTGQVEKVNPRILEQIIATGVIPVVCSVANDHDHHPLNVNADSAAAAIAVAVGASKLILLTDTDGVMENAKDPSTRISELTREQARAMIQDGRASEGMIPKLEAATEAVNGGVTAVHLINGATLNSLLTEVFTDHGIGTMMRQ
jgi:acetylglutamate kinase